MAEDVNARNTDLDGDISLCDFPHVEANSRNHIFNKPARLHRKYQHDIKTVMLCLQKYCFVSELNINILKHDAINLTMCSILL